MPHSVGLHSVPAETDVGEEQRAFTDELVYGLRKNKAMLPGGDSSFK